MELFAAFNSDAYKLGHEPMYSDGTTLVLNNLTPRTDKIYRRTATQYYDGKLVFFGGQGAVHEAVENWDKFFAMDKAVAIARFKLLCDFMLGQDVINTDSLAKLHDIGYLPLEIRTLDEGDKVPMGIPVMTIRNTVDHAFWLVNFLETTISNLTWKSSTTATIAAEYKAMMTDFAVRTGVPRDFVLFQGHDFSSRGMSGPEDAARAGMGHLTSFLGTDSLGSVLYAQQYYGADGFVAGSVPATEHAVATSNILRVERALDDGSYFEFLENDERKYNIYLKMLQDRVNIRLIAEMMFLYELMLKFPNGILSYVTDSFDFWGVLTIGLPYMKEVIEARNGKLVIRPDSGDPVEVICGVKIHDMTEHSTDDIMSECGDNPAFDSLADITYCVEVDECEGSSEFFVRSLEGDILKIRGTHTYNRYESCWEFRGYDADIAELTAEEKGAAQVLLELFGTTITCEGYEQYADCIGLIYGDSITTQRCLEILTRLEEKGYASSCAVFGVGSFTYNCLTRDTFGFAVKATYTVVNGEGIDIFKDPKTDSKKKSAKGMLYVNGAAKGDYTLTDQVSEEVFESDSNMLIIRFLNGKFYNQTDLATVRAKL